MDQQKPPSVSESDKQKFFNKCGIDRSTRNVLSYGLYGVSSVGLLGVMAFTGGTVPAGVAIASVVTNGMATFLKTNKNMDHVLRENDVLKENINKLIDTKSSEHNSPDNEDCVELVAQPTE